MTSSPPSDFSDYQLKVDEQVQKFLELNHGLTFFLVTASVGTLGFTLSYAKERLAEDLSNPWLLCLIGLAALLALASAWAGLRALTFDQSSFRLHLRYSYERKVWDQLNPRQKSDWERVNHKAASARRLAFGLLVSTVVVQVIFLFSLILTQGDLPMHHYGEDSTHVVVSPQGYYLEFTNKVSGATITMNVPAVGALEDPSKRLSPNEARHLADEVAHLLRRVLE